MSASHNSPRPLTLFKLVMMCVVAIDSLKNLTVNAEYGSTILFFYAVAILTFFIPSALVTAELATALPETGGVYVWVREAFGTRVAFLVIWIQWLIAIIWYPTILSFIAVTLSYFFYTDLFHNKMFILSLMLILFWCATFFVSKGIELSSYISTVCAIVGVIIPMIFISCLGMVWVYQGNPIQIDFSLNQINFGNDHLRLFITLLYSLMGMEMIAVHAGDVSNPKRSYPLALFFSAIIILLTVIPASLAIAIVIPQEKIGLVSGVVDSFLIFFSQFNLVWVFPIVIGAIVMGSFGIFYMWLLNSCRSFYAATQDQSLPAFLQIKNKHEMPYVQLLIQGCIFTVLAIVFMLMPSFNTAFIFLTTAAAQLALIYYIFIFSAALYLRYKMPFMQRPFQVSKSLIVTGFVCLIPIITCVFSIVFGFLPPTDLPVNYIFLYEISLLSIMIASLGSAVLFYRA